MNYRMINGRAYGIREIGENQNLSKLNQNNKNKEINFKDILDSKLQNKGFSVSKHAAMRLENMNLSESDIDNIEKGFDMAEDKGSRNSLFLYKDVALVTSIENRTVITAVDKSRAKDNIFTNIDSVVII